MRYVKAFNIWSVATDTLAAIQPGQWVYAGDRSSMGRYLGVKRSGTVVVAWLGNERAHIDRRGYVRTLRQYAKD